MSVLTKAVIVETLCSELKINKTEAIELVEEFFEVIKETLESGQNIKLSGFGNFILRNKKERPGRNPKTGEEIPVEARRVVTFKTGLKLKNKIEEAKK